jgi:hypothetical protein
MNDDRIYTLERRFQVDETPTADWRVPRPQSPITRIAARLGASTPQHVLVVGSRGTGKTTELLHLLDAPIERRVVFLDLARQFDHVLRDAEAMEHLAPWEVVLLAGLAVVNTLERLGFPDASQHRRAIKDTARPLLGEDGPSGESVLDSAFGSIGAATMAAGAVFAASTGLTLPESGILALHTKTLLEFAKPMVRWGIPLGRPGRAPFADQDPPVQELVGAVNAAVSDLRVGDRPALLVIDGLDRIRSVDGAARLFVHSGLIDELACHLVATAPLVLARPRRADGSEDAHNMVRGFVVTPIPEVPIVARTHPEDPAQARTDGLQFFREVFARRTSDGEHVLTPAAVDALAFWSGGRVREFVRLVNDALFEALGSGVAGDAVVDVVLDHHRRTLEVDLHRGHYAALEALISDPQQQLPGSDEALFLLRTHRILPFLDGGTWYWPHPLLLRRPSVLRPGTGR